MDAYLVIDLRVVLLHVEAGGIVCVHQILRLCKWGAGGLFSWTWNTGSAHYNTQAYRALWYSEPLTLLATFLV